MTYNYLYISFTKRKINCKMLSSKVLKYIISFYIKRKNIFVDDSGSFYFFNCVPKSLLWSTFISDKHYKTHVTLYLSKCWITKYIYDFNLECTEIQNDILDLTSSIFMIFSVCQRLKWLPKWSPYIILFTNLDKLSIVVT